MKRIHGLLAGLAGATVAWLALLGSNIFSRTFVLVLPLSIVAAYGLFNLGIVVNKVMNFQTYPSEQKMLLEDILRAKQ
eukprot:CAMPEP_0182608836 /NCGR_PEP_ID=MMETSP1330-20130603/3138_1 /TAXON_ID=464278 /ORGANISM="Picochlorum sp., Strain RCC944" /LENGTH=77 /DNA_ID=CAMNT_0024827645 /DNA_START=53 /DNA_END=283 /DNA_ORIENTATION=+